MTRSAKINHVSAQKSPRFFNFAVSLTKLNYSTHPEMNAKSFKAYRMKISLLEQEIIIVEGVICANMSDFTDLVTYYPQAYYEILQHI